MSALTDSGPVHYAAIPPNAMHMSRRAWKMFNEEPVAPDAHKNNAIP
jgi:hypothetical protein